LVEQGGLQPPGIALDLGCGTGTNTLFLAELGFTAIGVDLAWLALNRARRRARAAGVTAYFYAGNVADLSLLDVRAVFALDIGCLHALSDEDRDRYAASLVRLLEPGCLYLLYGFDFDSNRDSGPPGFAPGEIARRFRAGFRLLWHRPSFQDEVPVAWYLLERQ
jgi:SAM-dependent methyltransferase